MAVEEERAIVPAKLRQQALVRRRMQHEHRLAIAGLQGKVCLKPALLQARSAAEK